MPEYILDTCVDIDPKNKNYPSYFFRDLHSNKNVRLVIGGTKAMHEVTRKEKLRRLLNELKTRGQLIVKDRALVDAKEKELENRIKEIIGESPQECDDLHIFALSKVSGCLLVISRDNRMAICRAKIRNNVGHEYCPSIKVIQNQNVYNTMKQ